METEFRFDDASINSDVKFDEALDEFKEELEPTNEPVEDKEESTDDLDESTKNLYLAIYDAIMFEDKYEKEVKLGKKYSAVFSTRSAEADVSVARRLDGMNFQTISAYQTMSAVLTMSYSLCELNGKDLRKMSTGDRFEFIKGKSSHLIEMLSKHMVDFDKLVRSALEYGESNF